MDKTKLIENAQRLLASREASLKDTLQEIAFLEPLGAPVAAALAAARTKRDRQHQACEASRQLIDALTKKTK